MCIKRILSSVLLSSVLLSNVYAADVSTTATELDTSGTDHTMPVMLEVESLVFSVSVPTQLPVFIDVDGNSSVAENASIVNNGNKEIQVTDITITPSTGWTLKAYDGEFGANEFGISINSNKSGDGTLTCNSFRVAKQQEVPVNYDIRIAEGTEGFEPVEIASVTMTVGWFIRDPNTQYTGDTLYDGATMVKMGEVLQLEAPMTYSMRSTWESSDTSIATISETGLVTPVQPGRVTMSYGDYEVPMHMYGESVAASYANINSSNRDVVLPDHYYKDDTWYTVTSIADNAFDSSSNLYFTSMVIPDTVTYIGQKAFYQQGQLSSIDIPDSVTYIGQKAFYGCNALKSIHIPESVTSILPETFYSCINLTSIVLHDELISIGAGAFTQSGIVDIEIPSSVIDISTAFKNCSRLKSLVIKGPIEKLDAYALNKCSVLESLYLPRTLTVIGQQNFDGYTKPTIYYEGTEGQWSAISINASDSKQLTSLAKNYNVSYR